MIQQSKHAFLIIAHNNREQLINLVKLLDDPLNDIYIHIDLKVHLIDDTELFSVCQYSKINIYRNVKVAWGAFSQIKCELTLLREASKEEHVYYHLISGVDLPIMANKDIHRFFAKHAGKEFVHFQDRAVSKQTLDHVNYYHFLQEYTNAFSPMINKIIRGLEYVLLKAQKFMRINRWDQSYTLQKGANWFSITHNLAKYVVSEENLILKKFSYSLSGDELFLQTLIENSGFKDHLYLPIYNDDYQQCVRLIDWKRGKPYVFQAEDYQEIMSSKAVFVRKCSYNLSKEMIKRRTNVF